MSTRLAGMDCDVSREGSVVTVLLADLTGTIERVAATRSRTDKTNLLAELLRALEPDEIIAAIGFLTGEIRQRTGVGWVTALSVDDGADTAPSLTLLELDRRLDGLAATSGAGSQAGRQRQLVELFEQATLAERDYIRRLLMGGLRVGALDGVVTDAVARAAERPIAAVRRAAMLSGDLGLGAFLALTGGDLDAVALKILTPVQPMLASTSASVREALTGPSSVEWKLDGIRVQVHRDGDSVRIFTRNLNDVTDRLGDMVDRVRSLPCTRMILDGELIGLREDDAPLLFQQTAGSFATEGDAPQSLRPFFFDCLHADGADLIDATLRERRAALEVVAPGHCVPALSTDDPDAAQRFADTALAAGHEGVMVKSLDSLYEAGRRGKAWRKVKPVRTLDLIVVGAEWGHGRRPGRLSNLHLGARDPDGGHPIMVGKTFKGLTDALLTWQTAELQQRQLRSAGITVFVRPELVVEIALDGVQISTRYPGGVALRFARVKRYRPDRSAADADTIDSVRRLLPAG